MVRRSHPSVPTLTARAPAACDASVCSQIGAVSPAARRRSRSAATARDLAHGLHGPHLAVGELDRDEPRRRRDGRRHVGRAHAPVRADAHDRAPAAHSRGAREHALVLGRVDDHVGPVSRRREGQVVRLGGAGRESHVAGARADCARNGRTGGADVRTHGAGSGIGRTRILELLAEIREHRCDDLGIHGRRGGIVQVYGAAGAPLPRSPLGMIRHLGSLASPIFRFSNRPAMKSSV